MRNGRRAVLVVCDSLRADLVTPQTTPAIWEVIGASTWCPEHRSVFPSTTRVVSASIATGCYPDRHGVLGNKMALDEGTGLRCLSTGKPDFLERLRRATGRTLLRPTLAERVAAHGGAIVMSNVSPGAAYLQDPEGFGRVYHRAGSFGPGRHPVPEGERLDIQLGAAGDAIMTARFCNEVLCGPRPALAVLWLSEPDHTGHREPLGSPAHRAAIAAADRCVAEVVATLERAGSSSDGTLLAVCSDHGMETVTRVVQIDDELVRADLKASPDSSDVVVAPNGTGALIYRNPEARVSDADLRRFLGGQDWVGRVLAGPELECVGLPTTGTPAFGVSLRIDPSANLHGIPGTSWEAFDPAEPTTHLECGQHGGLGPNEQRPFLCLRGAGFSAGGHIPGWTSPVDLAPTILRHLGLSGKGMDGRPLQGRASSSLPGIHDDCDKEE